MISSHQRVFFTTALLAAGAVADEMTASTGSELQTLRVSVQTPSPCWAIEIEAVYSTDQELLVVSKLAPPASEETCIQMVGQAEDEISLTAPLYRIKHLILGRTWDTRRDSSGWGPEAEYVYLKSNEELSPMLKNARRMPETGEEARDGHAEVDQPMTLSR
ncbi:MAG: hypothetical protein WAN46_18430 [Gammaproteobacteria bacterium]|jgi:hypothetical protein